MGMFWVYSVDVGEPDSWTMALPSIFDWLFLAFLTWIEKNEGFIGKDHIRGQNESW